MKGMNNNYKKFIFHLIYYLVQDYGSQPSLFVPLSITSQQLHVQS